MGFRVYGFGGFGEGYGGFADEGCCVVGFGP